MSYKNVVSMVGTNDLKLPDCNVMNTYQKYKGKLEKIRELNPRCNIFVCPVLPSRSQKINEKIFQFNGLLFDDLVKSSININLVRGLGEFLDRGNQWRIQSNVVGGGGGCQNCWGGASSTARSAVEQVRPRQGELRQGSGGAKIGLLES